MCSCEEEVQGLEYPLLNRLSLLFSFQKFAHWTQRGYYPDDPHKQNQDEFGTHLQFAGVEQDAMFVVYDGHGKEGHACARFAQEKLPKAVAKHVRKLRCQKYQKLMANNNKQQQGGKKKVKGAWNPDKWPMLDKAEYDACCRKAYLEVNQAMHDDPKVVDTLSGTTATSVFFHGNFVSVANVGDSRAIIGHRVRNCSLEDGEDAVSIHYPAHTMMAHHSRGESYSSHQRSSGYSDEEEKTEIDDGEAMATPVVPEQSPTSFDRRQMEAPGTRLLAIPLSRDQTPYRKDERERVKALGASVLSIDQMQGKEEIHENWGDMVLGEQIDVEGDSPRVWVKGKDYPGCAFTRSLGDSTSESIGVMAVPEILTTELTQNDEFLVIASDGIFEFLTNQMVMDFCAASESPLVACEKIVKASYQQWLNYENRTDDITIIVCFLQNFRAPPIDGSKGTTEDLVETVATIYGERSERMSSARKAPCFIQPEDLPIPEPDSLVPKVNATNASTHKDVEKEAVAYVSEEAHAVIVPGVSSPAPAPQMTLDYPDTVEVKIDALMQECHSVDKGTSKTSSIASTDEDKNDKAERPETTMNRNAIQI